MWSYPVFYEKCIICQPYNVTVAPVNLPVSLDDVKEHLRLDPTDTSQDAYLTLLIKTATSFAEKYTRRTFIDTTFETFLSCFCCCIELRRSKVTSIVSFEYLESGVLTAVDADIYYLTDENAYAHILLEDGSTYPTPDVNAQAVKIVFVAGYGPDDTDIPDELKLALLNHIASLYENRGDCSPANATSKCMGIPSTSKLIYDQFRIEDIGNGPMCS